MLKVVYFDYHGVLDRRKFDGLLEVIGRAANPADAQQVISQLRQTGYAYATGRISPHVFWHQVEAMYGSAVSTAGRNYALHVEPIREVWNIVSTLHDRFEVGLCSDCAIDKKEVLRSAYALTDYFDFLILSCDVQSCKRDVEFYRLMLQHGRFQPNECLLIDDVAANTGLADSIGFQTHTYRDPDTLKAYIETL